MSAQPIQLDCMPERVLLEWPRDRSLGVLWSGGGAGRSRWTLLADTSGARVTTLAGEPPRWPIVMVGEVGKCVAAARGEDEPPFVPGWLGVLSYELGGVFEPRATAGRLDGASLPLMQWQRFESALAFDHERGRWWGIGADAPTLVRRLRRDDLDRTFALGPLTSRMGRVAFEDAVLRAIEHIRAGDVYQVNLTHRLEGAFSGSSRRLFAALSRVAMPWYGAYMEVPNGQESLAIASVSPELFLAYDPYSRRVETRPMKGTRAAGTSSEMAATMRDELRGSTKDQAELAMIVDLMRNDLGRVCEARSILVEDARAMERHASLLQTTATVSGTLARSCSLADLVRATFPGGSITGAPKIRAMQIIEALEPLPRGAYCGSIGYVGDDGSLQLNIAIRTAVVRGRAGSAAGSSLRRDQFEDATLSYGAGAGIVADSEASSEWEETLAKAGVIGRLATIDDRSQDPDSARPR